MTGEFLEDLFAHRQGQNPYDYLGHVLAYGLNSLPRAMGIDATIKEVLPDKYWKKYRQLMPDVVAKLRNYRPRDIWVKGYYLHIELVDRLRKKPHEEQTAEYERVIRGERSNRDHIIHVILVIGPIAPTVAGLRYRTDQSDRPDCVRVRFLDALLFSRLSKRDQRSHIGRILGMIVHGARDPKFVTDGVRAAFRCRNEKERALLIGLVVLIAHLRPALRGAIEQAYKEEEATMNGTSWEQVLLADEHVKAAIPLTATYRRGERRGEKRGEKRKQIDSIVRIMAERKKPLSQTHIAQLERMSCERLPTVELAMRAKSANDFARKAGLAGNGAGQ